MFGFEHSHVVTLNNTHMAQGNLVDACLRQQSFPCALFFALRTCRVCDWCQRFRSFRHIFCSAQEQGQNRETAPHSHTTKQRGWPWAWKCFGSTLSLAHWKASRRRCGSTEWKSVSEGSAPRITFFWSATAWLDPLSTLVQDRRNLDEIPLMFLTKTRLYVGKSLRELGLPLWPLLLVLFMRARGQYYIVQQSSAVVQLVILSVRLCSRHTLQHAETFCLSWLVQGVEVMTVVGGQATLSTGTAQTCRGGR